MKISAVVLAKNEEVSIAACLKSLSWCDEVLVVDDLSTDKTVEIAKEHQVKVYTHLLENNFSQQRNFGLEKATSEWVLFVDADEQVTDALKFEIQQVLPIANIHTGGYLLKRSDMLWGKELRHGEMGNVKLLRLGRKGKGLWHGKVHETWEIHAGISELKNPIKHFPHQTIEQFLREINFYTTLRAEELKGRGKRVFFWDILLYPKMKFLVNYFWKKGFLDGIVGFIAAILMSFHSFLVRAKLWLLWQKVH